ncbi:hypothetical protein ASD8599_00231 [Ascidiaceihabitans donghaensis]|uniref:CENP-V/GFA domain-containing protein n=1 Tax=Ascidiaceihabitans donghaensis TaxID=1510460 RepID=A0A2R8B8V6_9RHOB|nr:GFA family protein [Ascidiaceihabitans donghaensis]SPH19505.1 hypothetical protein ASD8599_00231 [Ascidiaceihabitans donghaensis]
MTSQRHIEGRCLCGAVTVKATVTNPIVRACHCDMCRRHTSSMFMSLATDGEIDVQGPFQTFQSSEWAERGFCSQCGSTLWYGTTHDGVRNLSAGLFDDAAGAPLKLEFFADAAPKGYALAGDHRKMTTVETLALFAPEDDA